MEVPGPPVSSKPGETSVKWQLCYDMTAKMWWMVSAEVPAGTQVGACAVVQGAAGTVGSEEAPQVHGPLGISAGVSSVVGSGGDPSLGIRKSGKVDRSGGTKSRQGTGKPFFSLAVGSESETPQTECVSELAGPGGREGVRVAALWAGWPRVSWTRSLYNGAAAICCGPRACNGEI